MIFAFYIFVHNLYHSEPAKIIDIKPQTDTIKLFWFKFEQKVWGYNFSFKPGQIVALSLPNFGEAPFAVCNAPGAKYLELCVRAVGKLTNQLHRMKKGDKVGIRGPYGHGWPIADAQNQKSKILGLAKRSGAGKNQNGEKKNVLIVVGGLGLIPLRTLILGKDKFLGKDTKIQIFYGAKTPKEMLFRYEYAKWRANNVQIELTVDQPQPHWSGKVGLVTTLFDNTPIVENARAFICGPPVMYKAVLAKLKDKGFAEQDIYLSLERRMHCGVGVCQHCGVGPYYTCKDGPVFNYSQIKDIPGAI
ncbi:MAG: oxidoreductase [Candidatus Portnoybacteria bacterium CG02_land_8_20_14_3_00_45_8]|uniref:Oxidoreductase n=1 Tax=Candidatus Portnoybacteria bacterium CG02_land_8_20_14_3_00_45_8 TaxID=1974807 RepID=A0A2M7D6I2_9BACT|nr:MAG: oxidoreductase [Candidatus Portnoybacteria bacterium CG02_land_8_20_14_3_00_45_8]